MKFVAAAALGAFVCTLSLPVSAEGPGQYEVVDVEFAAPSPQLYRTKLSISRDGGGLDTFDVIRVHRRALGGFEDPPVILIAPFGFSANFWELTNNDYDDSFAARVVLSGYDVWLIDSRSAHIPPGSCESGAVDCSPLAQWGVDRAIADAMYVRRWARLFHPSKRPAIGGLSGGSSTAIAAVDRYPHAFAALFMWEGTLYTADADVRSRNAAFCDADEAQLASGVVVDPSVQVFATILELASTAPNDPSPLPGLPPGTTNFQALVFAFSAPNPQNPLNFTEDFVRLVGDPFAASFAYADVDRLLRLAPLVATYAPVRFLRDTHCAIGGLDPRHTDRLGAFRGDVLVYADGLGFGQMMIDTAALMTHARVVIDYQAEFGESDRYFHQDWTAVAVDPLTEWLDGLHWR